MTSHSHVRCTRFRAPWPPWPLMAISGPHGVDRTQWITLSSNSTRSSSAVPWLECLSPAAPPFLALGPVSLAVFLLHSWAFTCVPPSIPSAAVLLLHEAIDVSSIPLVLLLLGYSRASPGEPPSTRIPQPPTLQGCLAQHKPQPPSTLQQDHA